MSRTWRLASFTLGAGLLALYALPAGADQGPDPAVQGKKLYTARCLICHGREGDGQGPAGEAMRPPPTDFSSQVFWRDARPAKIKSDTRDGIPGSAMRPFPDLSDEDLDALLAYIQTFKPASP